MCVCIRRLTCSSPRLAHLSLDLYIQIYIDRYVSVYAWLRITWPSHDIAITNIVWCMAYKRGVGGGVVYCAIDVQWYGNSAGSAGGKGQQTDN